MGVLGQPKTTAEYIQATSRVGRRDSSPGLVITVLNIHRPRDRSHYERFRHFHATFYRSVEVASVTPFSARALDRGLTGAAMAMARHAEPSLTPPRGAEDVVAARAGLEARLLALFEARLDEQAMGQEERSERRASVRHRIVGLLDDWTTVSDYYSSEGVAFGYQRYEEEGLKPLLREMLETEFDLFAQGTFRVNRSLRDVEPSVNLFIKEPINGKPMPATQPGHHDVGTRGAHRPAARRRHRRRPRGVAAAGPARGDRRRPSGRQGGRPDRPPGAPAARSAAGHDRARRDTAGGRCVALPALGCRP
jgi:hypothetical protein